MQTEVRQLLVRHCATLRQEIEEIGAIVAGLGSGTNGGSQGQLLSDGISRAHKMKGSSGSIGFAKVSAAARQLEADFRAANVPMAPAGANERIAQSHAALAELISTVSPEESRLFSADFSLFENNPLPGASRR